MAERRAFIQIEIGLVGRAISTFSPSAFALYLYIRERVRRRNGRTRGEQELLEDGYLGALISTEDAGGDLGFSHRQIRRLIKELDTAGWIVQLRTGRHPYYVLGKADQWFCDTTNMADHERERLAKIERVEWTNPDPVGGQIRQVGGGPPILRGRSKVDRRKIDPDLVSKSEPERQTEWTSFVDEVVDQEVSTSKLPEEEKVVDEPSGRTITRRERDHLKSARAKTKAKRTGAYTGAEIVAAWRLRFFRAFDFEDPDLETKAAQRNAGTLALRRAKEWFAGDRAELLRYLRETLAWWADSKARGETFPSGVPRFSTLLEKKRGGDVAWTYRRWRSGSMRVGR